jgi:hypothetical protein
MSYLTPDLMGMTTENSVAKRNMKVKRSMTDTILSAKKKLRHLLKA